MARSPKTAISRIGAFSALSIALMASALAVPLDGSVTSHDKILLPRQVAVVIVLLDESRGDREITRQRIRPRGGQLPVSFRLHFDETRIHPDRHYAIEARIELDDKLLFAERQPYPIDPLKAPQNLTLYVHPVAHDGKVEAKTDGKSDHDGKPAAHEAKADHDAAHAHETVKAEASEKQASPAAHPTPSHPVIAHNLPTHLAPPRPAVTPQAHPAATPPVHPTTVAAVLIGMQWKAEQLEGHDLREIDEPTLSISADKHVSGSSSCNRYMGEAKIDGAALSFGPLATTKIACLAGLDAIESDFIKALADTRGYRIEAGRLDLLSQAGQVLVRFKPAH